MEFFSRRHLLSPLLLVLVYFTYLAYAKSHHIRHHRDRFKRQQGAHLYLPGSYVTSDGDDEPDAGPWLEWSSPSQCSRTCGGGVSTQYRQCTPGHRCSGPTRRHFSCNTQDCPDLADFRVIQCAEFNNVPFEGTLYEWVPYTKSPQQCELNCMPKGERFYYRHKLQVIDGTKCNDETLDVCVEGKCQPVGCDMMLGSDAREDRCRVCEGNGSTCNTMSGLLDMQDLQVGYNDVLLIPAGAVNIKVREADRSNNYLAVRNASGHYYLNGNWRIDFPRTLDFAGSRFHYERSPQGFSAPDSITSLGPIEESIFIVLLYQDVNVGIRYEYSLPKTIQHPNDTETYAWTFDQFTQCSASCGGGYQSRNVSCAGRKSLDPVESNLCDANNKPVETQRCGEIPCEPKWVAKEWEKCSATCGTGGTQNRKIYCEQVISSGVPSIVDEGQCAHLPKLPSQQSCNEGVVCGEWHVGPWKPCNRLCGKGKESRKVTCYRKVDGKISVLDESECTHAEKPESSKSCLLRPCEGVDWVSSEWSGCENKCGLSEETRIVQCMTASGEVFPDRLCAQDEERPETTRKCETKASGCDYEWYASQWSECSAKCGTGIQTRKVLCTKVSEDGFKKVEESNCDPSKKYDASRNCTAEETECPGEWFTGPWTKCSKTCGGGMKSRKVLCVKGNVTVHIKECDPDLIQSSSEECNKQACDEDEIIPVVTSEPIEVTEPTIDVGEEYEIVEDDKCEGGEWVDADGVPQPKLGPTEKILSLVSKTLGESTESETKGLGDSPLLQDELMQSDSTLLGDGDSAVVVSGSGDGDGVGYGTSTPEWLSSFGANLEGSGEGSGDDTERTDFTEVTETPFVRSSVYTVDSSKSTESSSAESDTSEEMEISSEGASEETDAIPTEAGIKGLTTEATLFLETDETVSTVDVGGITEDIFSNETEAILSELYVTEITTEETISNVTVEVLTETDVTDEATEFTEGPTEVSVFSEADARASTVTGVTESMSESASVVSEIVTEVSEKISVTQESVTLMSEDVVTDISEEPTKKLSTDSSEEIEEVTVDESVASTTLPPAEIATLAGVSTSAQPVPSVFPFSEVHSGDEDGDVIKESAVLTTEEVEKETEGKMIELTTIKAEIASTEDITKAIELSTIEAEITSTDDTTKAIELTTIKTDITSTEDTAKAVELTSIKTDITSTEDTTEAVTKEIEKVTESEPIETTTSVAEETSEMTTLPSIIKVSDITDEVTAEITSVVSKETSEITTSPSITEVSITNVTEEAAAQVAAVEPTTVIPTTVEPKTVEPTTVKPTTVGPTTVKPKTVEPTTAELTTAEPTTVELITAELTTVEPTTVKPATVKAKTVEPTTVKPTTVEPTTVEPTTVEPTTVEPTTAESITAAQTTIKPSESTILTTAFEKPVVLTTVTEEAVTQTTDDEELTTVGFTPEDKIIEGTTKEIETVTEEVVETTTVISQEIVTEPTTEYDIWSSTEKIVPSTEKSSIIEIFTTARTKWCRKLKVPSCKRSEFGCCPDKVTAAKGPFDKGCPIPETCGETKYGCCEDGVSPAAGENFKGCPESLCDQTLFGCCPDGKTPSQGNDNEGCPVPPPKCTKSVFGCCEDNTTEAKGPNREGCEETKAEYTTEEEKQEETESPTTTVVYTTTEGEDCSETAYGCCPDGVSVAQGEFFKGCDIIDKDCNKSFYKCCPDGIASALGPNYQGCITECSKSSFGCCEDGITPAHGYSMEGCCLSSEYGCCADNIKPAEGPNQEGCGCAHSAFGCCPDNVTHAQGINKEGCGCQYTEHGCCPDNHTPASGSDYLGCLCHTFQFGCCPDGVTVAKGSRNVGCGCSYTEFGCCTDEKTVARGPNYAGCDCSSSKYGCCPDGETEAQGEDFDGCTDIPENLQANCQLAKDRGTCRNYTVKWFYDMEYGGCSRFWYGGCDGNGNRFKTKEECNNVCVEPTGKDRCNLPKVVGPCEGYYPQWYYDKTNNHCTQFIFGGCLGNNNRFETREECSELCVTDRVSDACEQPKQEGPCHGSYVNWFYNKETGYCERFVYGGCKGNDNNFPTVAACNQKCAKAGQQKPSCALPQAQGNCTERIARWYYDSTEKRCMPFYYSGCGDNKNNYISQYHCEIDCPKEIVRETCQLPADPGDCSEYVSKYYYDTKDKACKHFYYGGCGGNGNNFDTESACEARCVAGIIEPDTSAPQEPPTSTAAPEPFKTEFCHLPPEVGPCRASIARWHYNNDGTCKQFTYGGCGGNKNNFGSSEECYQMCGNADDICTLPMIAGPCNGEYEAWFYNQTTDTCETFKYGGCMGNGNRFDDSQSCEARCRKAPPTTAATKDFCQLPAETGPCRAKIPRWYHSSDGTCKKFIYGGCGGNSNNFETEEKCSRTCGGSTEFCQLPRDSGRCFASIPRWYYSDDGTCKEFIYGGCGGNRNNFETSEECSRVCGETKVQPTAAPDDATRICYQSAEVGNCTDAISSYYFDPYKQQCTEFTYSGCGGNENRFSNSEACDRTCGKYRGEKVCTLPSDAGKCRAYIKRFYYDKYTKECKEFIYGGCEGNGNRFHTVEECKEACAGTEEYVPETPSGPTTSGPSPAEICLLSPDTGTCSEGNEKRFYYDNTRGECVAFIYSGCGGNANNFYTNIECYQTCKPIIESTYEPVVGPGPAPEQPVMCKQYQEECRTLRCQYGMKGYVENLCNKCECIQPCAEDSCPQHTRCAVELNRNLTDSSESHFIAVCREVNKPGDCPHVQESGDDCREDCNDDADCVLDLKCCSSGCGRVCVMPTITTLAPPGELRTTESTLPGYTRRPTARGTYAPEIIEDEFEPNVTAGEGDYATLRCAVRGNPKPVFTWSKDNVLIDGKEPRYRILLEGAALQIISLYKTDAGIYLCSADNNIGTALKKEIRLEVIDPVPHPTKVIDDKELSNVIVSLGSQATLNCYAYGYPEPAVMWWKGKEFIPFKSVDYTITKEHTLLINSVRLHNLGVYTCHAYNGVGRPSSWSVTVQALGPVYSTNVADRQYMKYVINKPTEAPPSTPRIQYPYRPTQTTPKPEKTPAPAPETTPPVVTSTTPVPTTTVLPTAPRIFTVPVRANITLANTNFPVGSDISIPCDVEGYPIPAVQWYKDSNPLQPSHAIRITESHRLIIRNATESDSGEYRCAAWNQYSNATSTVPLLIQGRFIHPSCIDNPFFANCPLIIKANFCSHKYYARFCCRSCTEAGKLPSVGPHLRPQSVQNDVA